jgi:threonine dehydratase
VAIETSLEHPECTARPSPDELARTLQRLAPWVNKTPVLTSRTLDRLAASQVFLKCENLQRAGAFKFRGAMNALLHLAAAEQAARGVVTHSSGNHAQALALAAQLLKVPACIVMPRTAPAVKRSATEGYGASIVLCEATVAARENTVADLIDRHGYTLVHPYDNWRVIAGQATAAMELIEQAGPLDMILCPVGGGGLLSGTALALRAISPQTRVIGVEPETVDDACRSLKTGIIQPPTEGPTVADGLRTALCPRTFDVIKESVEAIITVSEPSILEALHFVWERLKIVIEPSAAVAAAPLLEGKLPVGGLRIGVILSGGNLDLAPLISALDGNTQEARNGTVLGAGAPEGAVRRFMTAHDEGWSSAHMSRRSGGLTD